MKYSEIKNLEPAELRKRLAQNRQALFTARMKHKMQRLSNMMELRKGRRDMARLNTALSALPESAFEKKSSGKQIIAEKAPVAVEKVKQTAVQAKKKVQKPDKPSDLKAKQAPKTDSNVTAKPEKTQKSGVMDKSRPLEQKTKKWFGFLGSKTKSSQKPATGKKSFFRRKSI